MNCRGKLPCPKRARQAYQSIDDSYFYVNKNGGTYYRHGQSQSALYTTPGGDIIFDPGPSAVRHFFWGRDWDTGTQHAYFEDGKGHIERTFVRIVRGVDLPIKNIVWMNCADGKSRIVKLDKDGHYFGD